MLSTHRGLVSSSPPPVGVPRHRPGDLQAHEVGGLSRKG